jgi:hypothetical protein
MGKGDRRHGMKMRRRTRHKKHEERRERRRKSSGKPSGEGAAGAPVEGTKG